MFPCMIARTTTTDVISSGMGGTRNGALQLVTCSFQILYFFYGSKTLVHWFFFFFFVGSNSPFSWTF